MAHFDPCLAWEQLQSWGDDPGSERLPKPSALRHHAFSSPSPNWSQQGQLSPGFEAMSMSGMLGEHQDFMLESEGTPLGSEFFGESTPGLDPFEDLMLPPLPPLDGDQPGLAFPHTGEKISAFLARQPGQPGQSGEMDYEELDPQLDLNWNGDETAQPGSPSHMQYGSSQMIQPNAKDVVDPFEQQLLYQSPELMEGEMDFDSTDNAVLGCIPVVGEASFTDPGAPLWAVAHQYQPQQLNSEGTLPEAKTMHQRGAPLEDCLQADTEGFSVGVRFPHAPVAEANIRCLPLACDIPGWRDWKQEEEQRKQQQLLNARQAKHVQDRRVYRRKIQRYAEKRKNRNFGKRVVYECRRRHATSRPRVNGRFIKEAPKPQQRPLLVPLNSWASQHAAFHASHGVTGRPSYVANAGAAQYRGPFPHKPGFATQPAAPSPPLSYKPFVTGTTQAA